MRVQFIFLLCLLFFSRSQDSYGQNLVPNPSFEDHTQCPMFTNQAELCVGWQNFGNSPDYWSTCAPSGQSLPYIAGYQYPHTGNYLMALILYRKDPSAPPNYREFIGIQLSSPTIIGQKYFLSFYCNNTEAFGIACNKMGMKLSTVSFDSCCPPPISNSAHLYTDSTIVDTLNWHLITGSFVADSVYSYLILGSFFSDTSIDTIEQFANCSYSYYYFDDICLSTDSNYNQTWTNLPEFHRDAVINLFPNPAQANLEIESNNLITEFIVYNLFGQSLISGHTATRILHLDVSNFDKGVFLIAIKTKNNWQYHKFIHN